MWGGVSQTHEAETATYGIKYGGECALKLYPCRDCTSWSIRVYDMRYFRENGEDLQIASILNVNPSLVLFQFRIEARKDNVVFDPQGRVQRREFVSQAFSDFAMYLSIIVAILSSNTLSLS